LFYEAQFKQQFAGKGYWSGSAGVSGSGCVEEQGAVKTLALCPAPFLPQSA